MYSLGPRIIIHQRGQQLYEQGVVLSPIFYNLQPLAHESQYSSPQAMLLTVPLGRIHIGLKARVLHRLLEDVALGRVRAARRFPERPWLGLVSLTPDLTG